MAEDLTHRLIRRLGHFVRLSPGDKSALAAAAAQNMRRIEPRLDILQEGGRPTDFNLFADGWACRYRTLRDGRRQLVGFLLPGDLCDFGQSVLHRMDHGVAAVTAVRMAEIPREVLQDVLFRHPRLTQALWWSALVDEAVQREWMVSVALRSAVERLAHLLCELFIRLRMVGLANDSGGGGSCEFPLTQNDLAEATGLSMVHVNRTLQELRSRGLIVLRERQLTVPNLATLQAVALFNPGYLHLDQDGRNLDARD